MNKCVSGHPINVSFVGKVQLQLWCGAPGTARVTQPNGGGVPCHKVTNFLSLTWRLKSIKQVHQVNC